MEYKHLYDVPIETMRLSKKEFNALKRTGVTSIGDCLDFFNRGSGAMDVGILRGFQEEDYTDLMKKLIDHGHGIYLLNSEERLELIEKLEEHGYGEYLKPKLRR